MLSLSTSPVNQTLILFMPRVSVLTMVNSVLTDIIQLVNLSLTRPGSAIYLFGDQVNDHGLYSIYFNQTIHATYNGRSGCGGGYAKYCEKLGGLRLFAGNLPAGEHSLKVVNESPVEGNVTFFGEFFPTCNG